MDKYLTFIVKSTIYGGGIMGVGYLLHQATVPSDEEMTMRLKEAGRTTNVEITEERRRIAEFYKILQENAQSDRPIWDVRGVEPMQPATSQNSKR
ncbi:hypothetical protein DFJ77DRAFT_448732 [Powellomyces hirtus]|nr:hypothetical protein DFJ77DRAFT_448732 [Powellomyces hirtus]